MIDNVDTLEVVSDNIKESETKVIRHPGFYYADANDIMKFRRFTLADSERHNPDGTYTYATWDDRGRLKITSAIRNF